MDIKTILTVLDRHGIEYLLVGTLGAIAHGARLQTNDVDICNATHDDNSRRIAAALRELRAYLIRQPTGRDPASINLDDWPSLRLDVPNEHHLFATPFGQIDVLPAPFGPGGQGSMTNYEKLLPRAITVRAFGLDVAVAAFEDISAAKHALGRQQDLVAEKEMRRIAGLLARGVQPDYGLEQFASWKAKLTPKGAEG
jgi:hypothetical protein